MQNQFHSATHESANKYHSEMHESDNKNHIYRDCYYIGNIDNLCQCDCYQYLPLCSECEKKK